MSNAINDFISNYNKSIVKIIRPSAVSTQQHDGNTQYNRKTKILRKQFARPSQCNTVTQLVMSINIESAKVCNHN